MWVKANCGTLINISGATVCVRVAEAVTPLKIDELGLPPRLSRAWWDAESESRDEGVAEAAICQYLDCSTMEEARAGEGNNTAAHFLLTAGNGKDYKFEHNPVAEVL